ncbi:inosine-5-monophosphate dehydrogenase [Skermanella stibiiresistens SB22]|uniref:Inosine-5-monophosphate dehydrogenase n=1 Tax=Skermanella stibiiresistens SB22 TaxID=1385369 RepID=W9HDD3_9PROT|nr:CBS domain-containing protein [Skermanella stibiiresistens]EWY42731.1 inosine-5-monophosphate dehydrogenase [Skermanella stibiiresistens SB22]
MPKRRLIPGVIRDQHIISFTPSDTVRAAVSTMAERKVGAVLVMVDSDLKGIFTERDLSFRVVAKDLDPNTTTLSQVMTADPDTLPPDAMAAEALDLMRQHNYRHLPVVSDGKLVGIVSIRDLYAAVHAQLEQEIQERDLFIFGQDYSIGA